MEVLRRIQEQVTIERLAVLARVYETDALLVRLPIVCRAVLRFDVDSPDDEGARTVLQTTHVVGSLSTDHVGYASFDLRMLRDADTLVALARKIGADVVLERLSVTLALELRPFDDPLLAIDALAEGDLSPRTVVVAIRIEAARLAGRDPDLALPSLQNPGIADWRLSPGSFAFSPERLVGHDGCEDLYPSDLSTFQFEFSRHTRLIDKHHAIDRANDRANLVKGIRYGLQMRFENRWYPIGHSLGQVLYSLPLAPGEKVKLAIADWRRDDSASRDERTALTEQVDHDSERDRTITEVVRGAVSEMQEGGSSMGGFSLSALVPLGDLLVGGALGIGATSSDSQGLRNLTSDMSQDLSDRIRQSSSAVRQLRSTVISQTTQSESGRFETRTVSNHNHCHTLTILYYEVLRHYRIVTALQAVEPTLFVEVNLDAGPDLKQESEVLANRASLERAIRDRRLLAAFDALLRVRAARVKLRDAETKFAVTGVASDLSAMRFRRFYALFGTGGKGTDSNIFLEIERTDGGRSRCVQIDPLPVNAVGDLDSANTDDFERGSLTAFVVEPEVTLAWGDIAGFVVRHARTSAQATRAANNPDQTFDFGWQLDHLRIVGITADDVTALVLDRAVNQRLSDSATPVLPVRDPAAAGPSHSPPALTDFVPVADVALAEALMEHLAEFRDHYRLAALIGGDAVERAIAFADVVLPNGLALSDLVENRVIASAGAELAFPLTPVGDRIARDMFELGDEDRPSTAAIESEELVSLPTRGVFADGKLGRCSTCETIDNTRFWDFQTSPLPGDAPTIAPLDTSSRFQQPLGLAPTALPASLLNIVNPAPAPDPSFAAAMQTLGSASLFRDMSGSEALGGFLSSLAGANAKSMSQLIDSQQKPQIIDKIKDMDELSPEQKTELIGRLVGDGSPAGGGDGSGDDTPAPDVDVPPGPDGTAPAPKPPTADKPRSAPKPTRPKPPPPPGKRFMQVELNLQGVLSPADVTVFLTVDPVGDATMIHFDPVVPSLTSVQVELPGDGTDEGIAKLLIQWDVVRVLSEAARAHLNSTLGRSPVKTGHAVQVSAECAFKFAAGDPVITLRARPIIATRNVRERSFFSAELAASVSLGVSIFAPISTKGGLVKTTTEGSENEVEFEVLGVQGLELTQLP